MAFLIKNSMTKSVYTIDAKKTVYDAAKMMHSKNIGALVVMVKSKPVGIITLRDVLSRVVLRKKDCARVKVTDAMTKKMIILGPGNTIDEAVYLLEKKKIKKLPIMHKNRLVGIITMTDLLQEMRKIENKQSEKLQDVAKKLHHNKLVLQEQLEKIRNKQ
jgi:CBS domain-containing protein